jgi:hypothetical protein
VEEGGRECLDLVGGGEGIPQEKGRGCDWKGEKELQNKTKPNQTGKQKDWGRRSGLDS